MKQQLHKVAGVFPDTATVAQAEQLFQEAGFAVEQVNRIHPEEPVHTQKRKMEAKPDGVREEFIRNISVGTGVGGVAGAIGATGIGLGLPALYVSAPVVAPLMVLGYAATLGGLAGAAQGLHVKEDVLASLIEDALHEGYPVLMIHAIGRQQTDKAHELMQYTMPIENLSA